MNDINMIWILPTALLCVAAFIIAVIPSGPECQVCKTHFTQEVQFKHFKKTTSKSYRVKFTYCFVCKKNFDIVINGLKKSSLDELKEDQSE